MGKAIQDKDTQLVYLKERLNMFIEVLIQLNLKKLN